MYIEEFKLNKKNYKEIEYILNQFIGNEKKNYKDYVKQNVFSIEVCFECEDAYSVFTFVDEIKISEWNDGVKVFLKSKETEHSIYYRGNKDIYSRVWFSGGGGRGDGAYIYTRISFSKPIDSTY